MAEKTKKKPKRQTLRLIFQLAFAALSNGYLAGFFKGKIYKGDLKLLCAPGMNCYSCPGALFACPMGALQSALSTRSFRAFLYVAGFLTVFGSLFGRAVCGFLCPFGLIQELLHRVPFPKKLKKLPGEKVLRLLKTVMLLVFAVLLPLFLVDAAGTGTVWFCKLVCPVGALEAGVPLVLMNRALQSVVGFLYTWKLAILGVILLLSLLIWRPFCRYLCPLGALYGFFNRFALYRFRIDETKCISCGACQKACKMDIPVWKKPNSMDCVRCGACRDACPTGAIGTLIPLRKKKETSPEKPS